MDDRAFRKMAELMKLNLDDTSEIVAVQNNATVPNGAEAEASHKRDAHKGRQHAMHAAGLVRCSLLAVCERNSDVVRAIAGANPHQDAVLVAGARRLDRIANVAGVGHALPRDFENNVALPEAALRCGALRVNAGDNDAIFTGTRY
jgi:hypothetical protein